MTPYESWKAEAMRLADEMASESYESAAYGEWDNTTAADECRKNAQAARAALEAHLEALPMGEAVAHCSLTKSGKIEHFDGKPMVMVGPVGNPLHPVPLYRHPKESA